VYTSRNPAFYVVSHIHDSPQPSFGSSGLFVTAPICPLGGINFKREEL
jgi:hypothetical protein